MLAKSILEDNRLVAVDIGAAYGLPDTWQVLRRSAFFYLIEPDRQACAFLPRYFTQQETHTYKIIPVALSETGGVRKLYVANAPTGSSLLPPSTRLSGEYCEGDYFYPLKIVPIETQTLAKVFNELNEQQNDLFKLDTQGTELEILRGLGSDRMNRVLGVELEVGMPGAYRGQAQLSEVQPFMLEHGLELLDLRLSRVHRPYKNDGHYYCKEVFKVPEDSPTIARRIWEVDALFCKIPDPLLESKDEAAIRKLIVVYCTYRFFSEAYHLVEKAENINIFSELQANGLRDLIVAWHGELKNAVERGMQISWLRHG